MATAQRGEPAVVFGAGQELETARQLFDLEVTVLCLLEADQPCIKSYLHISCETMGTSGSCQPVNSLLPLIN